MQDAATRFYQRSHDQNTRANAGRAAAPGQTDVDNPSHRYHGAALALTERNPHKIFELGYGGPEIVAELARRHPEAEYYIADVVDRIGPDNLPPNVHSHLCNLDNDFPFADGSFDFVIAMMVIEHLYDPFHSFREVSRVCRPGATIVINLPNIASIKCRLQLLAGRMPVTSSVDWFAKREWDGNHLHYFTIADVKRIARLNGLALKRIHPVGGSLSIKALWPSLLCHEITYIFERTGEPASAA
jgi:SAM-dependent methyltransferase